MFICDCEMYPLSMFCLNGKKTKKENTKEGRKKRKKQEDSNQSISDSKRDINVNQKEKNYKGTGKKCLK